MIVQPPGIFCPKIIIRDQMFIDFIFLCRKLFAPREHQTRVDYLL